MQNIMLALGLLAACLLPEAAEARIDGARMALGGVTAGSTEAYLRATYGPPKSVSRTLSPARDAYVREYNYGDSFYAAVLEETHAVLWLMTMDRHNNVATPDGIQVGSKMEDVIRAYGEPDLRQIDGDADYLWYFAEGGGENRLVIRISYGKVTAITCGSK